MFERIPEQLQALYHEGGPVLVAILGVSVVGWLLLVGLALDLGWGPRSTKGARGEGGAPNQGDLLARLEEEERLARARSILGTIAGLAAVSPLLGLLGTVIGMMETFSFLGHSDVPRVDALAGGVSQALLTTQVGLIVALTLIAGHTWLQRRARSRALALRG